MKSGDVVSDIEPCVRVALARTGHGEILGPKQARLLSEVEASGSIMQATRRMRISYSHAMEILGKAEQAAGCKLVERHGMLGSSLSNYGVAMLACYQRLEQQVAAAARSAIEDMPDIGK